jgi:hypothetical protein
MFVEAYVSVKRFLQQGDWFSDVDISTGRVRRQTQTHLHREVSLLINLFQAKIRESSGVLARSRSSDWKRGVCE